jgi:hypothetical protein
MTFERWLFDPTVGKIVATLVGILIIRVQWGFVQRLWTPRVQDGDTRYQARKVITYAAYPATDAR